jgi:hypothetical protein
VCGELIVALAAVCGHLSEICQNFGQRRTSDFALSAKSGVKQNRPKYRLEVLRELRGFVVILFPNSAKLQEILLVESLDFRPPYIRRVLKA